MRSFFTEADKPFRLNIKHENCVVRHVAPLYLVNLTKTKLTN